MRIAVGAPEQRQVTTQQADAERIHCVTGVDGERHAVLGDHGGVITPQFAAVLDVVVDKERVVEHFQRGSRRNGVRFVAAESLGCSDAQRGAMPFPARDMCAVTRS
jgi:hypothetical protein